MKVKNVEGRSGSVANQFIITEEGRGALGNFIKREVFQSYDSVIVEKITWDDRIDIKLDKITWDYSKTTGKYRNIFLNETKKETEKKIKSGKYQLVNLNT